MNKRGTKYSLLNKSEENYEAIVERAKRARQEKLERLSSQGVASHDEEWMEEEPPEDMNEFESKAKQNSMESVPSEEEIYAQTRSIRKTWDRKTRQTRAGSNAPIPVDLRSISGMAEIKNNDRGVRYES